MKSISIFSLAVATTALIFASGCGKKEETAPVNKRQIITTTNWGLTTGKVTLSTGNPAFDAILASSGAANINFIEDQEACEKDDYIQFKDGGKVIIVDAGTKCSPPTDDDSGTWSLDSSETKFTLTAPFDLGEDNPIRDELFDIFKNMTIKSISANNFNLSNEITTTNEIDFLVFKSKIKIKIEMGLSKK